MIKKLMTQAKWAVGVVFLLYAIGFFLKASENRSPSSVQWQMPLDDIEKDENIYQILRNGLQYKIKSQSAPILAMGLKTEIGQLSSGEMVFFDNAKSQFRKHPYIFVTAKNGKWNGWIHVKYLGYKKE